MANSLDVQIQPETHQTPECLSESVGNKALSVAKYYEAKALYEVGDLEGCLKCLEDSSKLDLTNTGILYRYAWIALEANKPILAKNLYNRLIDLDPSSRDKMKDFSWNLYDLLAASDVMRDSGAGVLNTPSPRDKIDLSAIAPQKLLLAHESIQEEVALRALEALLPPARKRFMPAKTRRGAPSLQALHRSCPLRRRV